MKKYSILLLFLALLVQTHIIAQCEFDNPLEDLEWMENLSPNYTIIEYDYLGETVFFFESCEGVVDGPDYGITDCEGNSLCVEGGLLPQEPCESYYDNLMYIQTWQVGMVNCVSYDCATIPFGEAVYDECGECLSPNDSNFNECITTNIFQEVYCLDTFFYELGYAGFEYAWVIYEQPQNGTLTISVDNLSFEYIPTVDVVDGGDSFIIGHYSPIGDNYDEYLEFAIFMDCGDPIQGCTAPTACNYNPNAGIDNGSCIFNCTTIDFETPICNTDTLFYDLDYAGFEYEWIVYEQPQNGLLTLSDDNLSLEYIPNSSFIGDDEFIIKHVSSIDEEYEGYLIFDFGVTDCTPNVCEFDNPLEDLAWMENLSPNYTIIEYDYLGEIVFFIESCEGVLDGPDYGLTDCEGNSLCVEGSLLPPISCEPYYNSLIHTQTWQVGMVACVSYDCATIPFGDAVYDDCGECLLPNDPNFNDCMEDVEGCTDEIACNYDAIATTDDGSCEYLDCEGVCGGTALEGSICDDGDPTTESSYYSFDCDCIGTPIIGCTDVTACNYDNTATVDDGSCEYLDCEGVCGGIAQVGMPCDDGDPITTGDIWTEDCSCIGDVVPGCTDPTACNYDSTATIDDGSCTFDCIPTTTIELATCNTDTLLYDLGYAGFEYGWVPAQQPQNGTLSLINTFEVAEYIADPDFVGVDTFVIGHYSPIGGGYDAYYEFIVDVSGDCATNTCEFDNPLEDLEWLALLPEEYGIAEYGYLGETVFLIEICGNPASDGSLFEVFDCEGNFLCTEGGLVPEGVCMDFYQEMTFVQIWKEGAGDCIMLNCISNYYDSSDNCDTDCTLESALGSLGFTDFVLETYTIIEYEYLNETVFFIEACESFVDGLDYILIDCQGNILCEYGGFAGGEGCGDFINDLDYVQTIQEGEESLNCVTYDCNNIPFGEDTCNVDQDVWPGDVNYDGIANNEDVLYLGFKYGSVGSPRPNANTTWEAQLGNDWNDWQNNGENTKHADCDGDGIVAIEDMAIINNNYNLTHEVGKTNESGIPIYVELPDALNASDAIEVSIYLGDEEMMLEDFHGIAFTLEFSSEYVEEGSVSFDFNSDLLGDENENVIGLDKVFHSEGIVDIGIAKIDMQSVNGYGRVATMSLVMIDDIIGKEGGSLPFTITLTNITALNSESVEVEVADTTIQSEINTGINESALENTIDIYPNPTADYLYIDTQNQTIEFIQIFNMQGQTLLVEKSQSQKIDVQELPNGTYFLHIQTQQGIFVKKIQIIR